MIVYVWLPHPILPWKLGHAAINIANEYFSYNPDWENNFRPKWNTLSEDEKGCGKKADEIIQINIDKKFYPYILDLFNPDDESSRYRGYRGMDGKPYNLFENNCCDQVAMFMHKAILPYLVEFFGNSFKSTYWLNHELFTRFPNEISIFRYAYLHKLFYKNNSSKVPIYDEQEILNYNLHMIHRASVLHLYGPEACNTITTQKYLWTPKKIIYYAKYIKYLVESLEGKVPDLLWTDTVEWYMDGTTKPRTVPEVDEFKRFKFRYT